MNVIVQKKMKKGPFNLRQLSRKVKADGPGVSGGLVGWSSGRTRDFRERLEVPTNLLLEFGVCNDPLEPAPVDVDTPRFIPRR